VGVENMKNCQRFANIIAVGYKNVERRANKDQLANIMDVKLVSEFILNYPMDNSI